MMMAKDTEQNLMLDNEQNLMCGLKYLAIGKIIVTVMCNNSSPGNLVHGHWHCHHR